MTQAVVRRRHERGFGIIEAMAVALILSVALAALGLATIRGRLVARAAPIHRAARIAATELANGPLPATSDGGSCSPETPVTGWSDTLYVAANGTLATVGASGRPSGATPLLRQWKISADASGAKNLDVTVVILQQDGTTPARGVYAGTYSYRRVVK